MQKTIRPFLCFLILVLGANLWADKLPKFGKVSPEKLQMTVLPEDSDAVAVVLFDVGLMRIQKDFTMDLTRRVRIKILKEDGKDAADVRIPYWYKDKIMKIRAVTVLPNGKKIKLKKKDIHEESAKNMRTKVFAIPGVEVGSVIEFQYELLTQYLQYFDPWYFQHEYYTRLSQISVALQEGFAYSVFFRNTPPIRPIVSEYYGAGQPQKMYTWKMLNLPPIRKEPYMRSLSDYLAQLHFQLISYTDEYNHIEWIQTWPQLVAKQRDMFKEYFRKHKEFKKIVQETAPDSLSPMKRMKALYDYQRPCFSGSKTKRIVKEGKREGLRKELSAVKFTEGGRSGGRPAAGEHPK